MNGWFNDLKRDGDNPILNYKVYTMQCLRILETMILGESKYDNIHCAQMDVAILETIQLLSVYL